MLTVWEERETDIEVKPEAPGVFRWRPDTIVRLERVLPLGGSVSAVYCGVLAISGSMGWCSRAILEPGMWLSVQTDPTCQRVRVTFRRPVH